MIFFFPDDIIRQIGTQLLCAAPWGPYGIVMLSRCCHKMYNVLNDDMCQRAHTSEDASWKCSIFWEFSLGSSKSFHLPSFATESGHEWTVLVFPEGNGVHGDYMSVYLVPCRSKLNVSFALRVIDRNKIEADFVKYAGCDFGAMSVADWGFSKFMCLEKLQYYCENNKVTLGLELTIIPRNTGLRFASFRSIEE
jgi:hypothetical protein